MKLSWSHKIFLRLNKNLGKHLFLDNFFVFCAFWLAWILALTLVVVLIIISRDNKSWGEYITKLTIASLILSYTVSYVIAFLWKHERPIRELPNVKELFDTLGTWKSFPSDHTIAVVLFALIFTFATGSLVVGLLSGFLALLVGFARVYAGVHYPRDILGGIAVAIFCFIVVLQFLQEQPLIY